VDRLLQLHSEFDQSPWLDNVRRDWIENGEMLVVAPCVPDDWTAYRVEYRHPGSEAQFIIDVENPTGCAECVTLVEVDGLSLPVADGEARMPIPSSGGRFEVRITLGVKAG
jgi:cyclic beta-1,2-glucan synthetase